jgi:restriction system protein
METVTAQELRNIIGEIIAPTIKLYRKAKNKIPEDLILENKASDFEIDDFIFSNPYFDSDLVRHLTDPGLLGFFVNTANIYGNWKNEFFHKVTHWSQSYYWLRSSDLRFINSPFFEADEKEIWIPKTIIPVWLASTPSYLIIAQRILGNKRSLDEMHHGDFEKLFGELLEQSGWKVRVTRGTKDGGVDLIANKVDTIIGEIKTIWQAKKYKAANKVSLSTVRELSAIIEKEGATKGIIVTTSKLTKGAIEWVQKDQYRLGYLEGKQIEEWILGNKLSL